MGSSPTRTPVTSPRGRTERIGEPSRATVRLAYAPQRDGAADAGEIVWTWVPYEENDGRGKDRPVLVIARQDAEHVFAIRLTSHPHPDDTRYLALGAGEWDGQRRESWADLSQLYRVPDHALRREAAALDIQRFTTVARALQARYRWRT